MLSTKRDSPPNLPSGQFVMGSRGVWRIDAYRLNGAIRLAGVGVPSIIVGTMLFSVDAIGNLFVQPGRMGGCTLCLAPLIDHRWGDVMKLLHLRRRADICG